MRISYADLPFWVLLHHQGAYDLIDQAGLQFIQDWDMIEFERTVFSKRKPIFTSEQESCLRERLRILDVQMPLIPYRDQGTHHGFELFIVPQIDLGSHCPMFWAYLARAFTYDKLPMDEAYFEEKYKALCLEFDVKIKYNSGKYVPRFSNGVHGETSLDGQGLRWGWYTVRDRNRFLQSNPGPIPELYLDHALERLKWYVEEAKVDPLQLNPDIRSDLFMYYLDNGDVTERRKEVVTILWGLHSGIPMKFRDVAAQLGITHERVRQIERQTLQKMTGGKKNLLWSRV